MNLKSLLGYDTRVPRHARARGARARRRLEGVRHGVEGVGQGIEQGVEGVAQGLKRSVEQGVEGVCAVLEMAADSLNAALGGRLRGARARARSARVRTRSFVPLESVRACLAGIVCAWDQICLFRFSGFARAERRRGAGAATRRSFIAAAAALWCGRVVWCGGVSCSRHRAFLLARSSSRRQQSDRLGPGGTPARVVQTAGAV